MGLTLFIGGQEGVTWAEWQRIAQACEANGLDGLFTSDHYMPIVTDDDNGTLDAWTVLAGLAVVTSRIRLGTLVSPSGFRHPSNLARVVTTVDHLSGGRAELGLGSGSYEPEHHAFGFPFPPFKERLGIFAEQLEIIYRQWTEDAVDHTGAHYRIEGGRARPKPLQRPTPPIIVGGVGSPATTGPAVRFATEYNTWMPTVAQVAERRGLVVQACEDQGRDPSTLTFTTLSPAIIGATHADVLARVRELLDQLVEGWDIHHADDDAPPEDPRSQEPEDFIAANGAIWVIGTVDEARARIDALRAAGSEHVYLDHRLARDWEGLELMGKLT